MKRKLNVFSASQIKQFDRCGAFWAFNRVLGLPDVQTDKARRGVEIHREMELYALLGKWPESKAARKLAALYACPPPSVAEVEVPVRFQLPGGTEWVGYIDAVAEEVYDPTDSRCAYGPLSGDDDATVVLIDWKTTSDFKYALSPAELAADTAANIYAYEAYAGGAGTVVLRWVYVKANGEGKPRVVETVVDRAANAAFMDELAVLGWFLQQLYDMGIDPHLMTKEPDNCFKYGAMCPYREQCNPPAGQANDYTADDFAKEPSVTNDEFMTRIAPALPKRPAPPLPAKRKVVDGTKESEKLSSVVLGEDCPVIEKESNDRVLGLATSHKQQWLRDSEMERPIEVYVGEPDGSGTQNRPGVASEGVLLPHVRQSKMCESRASVVGEQSGELLRHVEKREEGPNNRVQEPESNPIRGRRPTDSRTVGSGSGGYENSCGPVPAFTERDGKSSGRDELETGSVAEMLRAAVSMDKAGWLDMKPMVEYGVINAPEGSTIPLAATPEEAAAHQGRDKPAEPVDELETLDKQSLFVLAVKEGCFQPTDKVKLREQGLRRVIREARTKRVVLGEPAVPDTTDVPVVAERLTEEDCVYVESTVNAVYDALNRVGPTELTLPPEGSTLEDDQAAQAPDPDVDEQIAALDTIAAARSQGPQSEIVGLLHRIATALETLAANK